MTPANAIRIYREAQGRARNVVHDFDDFEWIDGDSKSALKKLKEIRDEARLVVECLEKLVDSQ